MPNLLINPYKVGPPVTGCDFYGRSELLARAYQSLQQSNVLLLQGQRRIGKTSFLKQLAAYVEQVPELPNSVRLVPVLFDIQRYVQDSLPRFQMHLAEAIARSLPVPVPKLPEWEADPSLFRDEWLPQVVEQLGVGGASPKENRALMILVDEFDNFEGQASPQAMQTLIPFLGQLVSGEDRLKWVFAFGRLAGKLPIQYDPIVSASVQLRLSFLSPNEARELLEKPVEGILTYEASAIDRIYQLTSGQPHLTQAIASEVFQRVAEQERETATAEDVDAAVPSTLETYGSAIASIVKVPAIEERVLVAVAKLTELRKTTSRDEIINILLENHVQLGRDELDNAIRDLHDWELLKGEQSIQVYVELVRTWLIKNFFVEPSREKNLDLQSALAQSRFELAEKALQSGQYELANQDYKEALRHIPNHREALHGLAESYRLLSSDTEKKYLFSERLEGRVKALQNLYLYECSVINELTDSLIDYAHQAEVEKKFDIAEEQYQSLSRLHSSTRWKIEIIRVQMEAAKFQGKFQAINQSLLNMKKFDAGLSNEEKRVLYLETYNNYFYNVINTPNFIILFFIIIYAPLVILYCFLFLRNSNNLPITVLSVAFSLTSLVFIILFLLTIPYDACDSNSFKFLSKITLNISIWFNKERE